MLAGRRGYTIQRNSAIEQLLFRGFAAHSPTRLAFDIIAMQGVLGELPDIVRRCRLENIFPIVASFIPTGRTELGHFVGFAALAGMASDEQFKVRAALQPLTPSEQTALYRALADLDRVEFGIIHDPHPAYYTGFGCTQLLGIYVDIHGNIWPCVARSKRTAHGLKPALLGNIRTGATPSDLWRTDPWLAELRSTHTGICPIRTLPGVF